MKRIILLLFLFPLFAVVALPYSVSGFCWLFPAQKPPLSHPHEPALSKEQKTPVPLENGVQNNPLSVSPGKRLINAARDEMALITKRNKERELQLRLAVRTYKQLYRQAVIRPRQDNERYIRLQGISGKIVGDIFQDHQVDLQRYQELQSLVQVYSLSLDNTSTYSNTQNETEE